MKTLFQWILFTFIDLPFMPILFNVTSLLVWASIYPPLNFFITAATWVLPEAHWYDTCAIYRLVNSTGALSRRHTYAHFISTAPSADLSWNHIKRQISKIRSVLHAAINRNSQKIPTAACRQWWLMAIATNLTICWQQIYSHQWLQYRLGGDQLIQLTHF